MRMGTVTFVYHHICIIKLFTTGFINLKWVPIGDGDLSEVCHLPAVSQKKLFLLSVRSVYDSRDYDNRGLSSDLHPKAPGINSI